jgi:hypothetical protein
MCSMLDIQAAWSARLCCGPSGSRWNWLVASDVGGSKPTGTNPPAVMTGTVLGLPDLLHTRSSRRHAGPPALRHDRSTAMRPPEPPGCPVPQPQSYALWRSRAPGLRMPGRANAVAGAGRLARMRRTLARPRKVRCGSPDNGGRRLRGLAVCVVVVPPPVRWGLRIALRRVLPFLLAAERRDVQVTPGRGILQRFSWRLIYSIRFGTRPPRPLAGLALSIASATPETRLSTANPQPVQEY